MPPPLSPSESPLRRRTTRACDQCRKTKSRCEHPPHSQDPCRNCLLSGTECTFLEPSHKRGPPKGYLSALEQRLHDAEALLGVIISSTDPRATTIIQDLSKDNLAASIITRITNSTFGPAGRNSTRHRDSPTTSRRRTMDLRHQMTEQEPPMIDKHGHLVFNAPSHTWQDYLNLRLSIENRVRHHVSPDSYDQDGRHSPSDPAGFVPDEDASKLPTLTAAYHFPVSDSTHMTEDATSIQEEAPCKIRDPNWGAGVVTSGLYPDFFELIFS